MLISLYWLPIKRRIEYKLATLAFNYFDGTLAPYLSDCLSSYTASRSLHSFSETLFSVSRVILKSANARPLRCVCGTLFRYKFLSLQLSHLLNPSSDRTSSVLPSPESEIKTGPAGCKSIGLFQLLLLLLLCVCVCVCVCV